METAGSSYVLIHGKNISHGPLAGSSAGPHMSLEKLFPALLECFGIILCGYIAGRAEIITESQGKGLGSFVSKFALPALLFKNMVMLDFENVKWVFLWSILIAKVAVFVVVCVVTLGVILPQSRYSKAGLYAIFATQSNDFALGYPIVDALYRNTYPEYLQYIYLVAPVSLMLLNPIGFALCEVQKWKDRGHPQHSTLGILGVVVFQVLKNPIVFMVVVGIISHFVLNQQIPAVLSEFVDGLANSFGGAALFYLGLTMVGQLGKLTRDTGVALILLITAKLLLMPVVCKTMVNVLDIGVNSSNTNHTSLSNFAFLYGVFPTAPSVAIYAAHYAMELEVVTSGMVISTLLSAPIMYVSAWLLTIPQMDPTPLLTELENVSFNISIVSIIALVWTVAVMILGRKCNSLSHIFVLNLLLAQLLVCIGMISWNVVDNVLGKVLSFTVLYGSLYSTYIWAGLIPLCLALTNRDDLLRLRAEIFLIMGWGVPFLMVGGLLIAGERADTMDSAFFYGRAQIISTTIVLVVSLALGAVSLMGLSQGDGEQSGYQALSRAGITGLNEEPRPPAGLEDSNLQQQPQQAEIHSPSCSINSEPLSFSPLQTIPDIMASTQREHRNSTGHSGTLSDGPQHSSLSSEQPLNLPPPGPQTTEDKQTVRYVLLCLLLFVSLLANISSCLWWLFNQDPGRLYLELQFFCAVANYGQGFLSFGIFGLDPQLIISPFKRKLLGLFTGRYNEDLSPSGIPEEVRLTCTQFVRYHKDQCVQDIVHTRRNRCEGAAAAAEEEEEEEEGAEPADLQGNDPNHPNQNQWQADSPTPDAPRTQEPAHHPHQHSPPQPHLLHHHRHPQREFRGSDLVDWLVDGGLCAGRAEAEVYGARLQRGGVILNVAGQEAFKDASNRFYCFVED